MAKEKISSRAYLSLASMISIITSAIEVFKSECYGYLLGRRGKGIWMVEYAIPYQSPRRTPAGVSVANFRLDRIKDSLKNFSKDLQFLGEFHSHTQYSEDNATVIPSSLDLKTSIPGELDIICAINSKKREISWREKGLLLLGTVGDYKLTLGGYYVPEISITRINYRRVMMKCPSLIGV